MKEQKSKQKTIRKKGPRLLAEDNDDDNEETKPIQSNNSSTIIVSTGSCILTFVLLIVTILIYDMTFMSQETINIQAIKADLLSNVHNQTDTINTVIESLNEIHTNKKNLQIVNFIGSTGVGKTFTASILKRHFSSVYELNGPFHANLYQNTINTLKYATSDYCNLIIVEDLTESDIDNLLNFLKEVPHDLVALVICIFNIQETDGELNHRINYSSVDKIIEKFNQSELPHKIAKFHEFDRNQAKEWVVKQLIKKGVNFDVHSHVVESVLSHQDVRFHGLKGLSSKINLEL